MLERFTIEPVKTSSVYNGFTESSPLAERRISIVNGETALRTYAQPKKSGCHMAAIKVEPRDTSRP